MKFEIRRTSDWRGAKSPCEGAELTGVVTSAGAAVWSIEVADLAALLELSKKVGCALVIDADDDPPTIEIYDGRRE